MADKPIEQAAVRAELNNIMNFVTGAWDITNPDSRTLAVAKLMVHVSTLSDPANTERLNRLIKFIRAMSSDKVVLLDAILDSDPDSPELQFLMFVMGGTEMPAWWEVAVKAIEMARAESNTTPPVTPNPQPQPAPSTPQAETPQEMLDRLNRLNTATAQQTTPPADPPSTPDPVPPVNNGSGDPVATAAADTEPVKKVRRR